MESAHKAYRVAPALEIKKKSVNAIGAMAADEKISAEMRELKELVLGMNDKIRNLERKTKAKSTAAPRRRNELVCNTCRRAGHFACDFQTKTMGNRAQGLPTGRQSP